jgi:hypothetical protein
MVPDSYGQSAGSSRHSQIATDNVLKHGALSTGLRSNDCDLWQIYRVLYLRQASVEGETHSDCGKNILQLVHEGDQAWVVDVDAVTC